MDARLAQDSELWVADLKQQVLAVDCKLLVNPKFPHLYVGGLVRSIFMRKVLTYLSSVKYLSR
jgi:hypothetical protein